MSQIPRIPELDFTHHIIEDGGSLALAFAKTNSLVGIYWIDFADGSSYVGQSVSTRTRLAAHRRRWNDAVAVHFTSCLPEQLDALEIAVIQHVGKKRPLRNKLLTNRPGGDRDVVVTISPGRSLALPWDRSRRGEVSPPASVATVSPAGRKKFDSLRKMDGYELLADATASLIAGAIPSPTESQAWLWSVSALPSTNRAPGLRRLLALSAGRLEILCAFEQVAGGTIFHPSFLNLSPDFSRETLTHALRRAGLGPQAITPGHYRAVAGVQTVQVPDLATLQNLLNDPAILDAVYQLVITVMRQGSAPLGRFHNQLLAEDVLVRAQKQPAPRQQVLTQQPNARPKPLRRRLMSRKGRSSRLS